MTERTRAHAVKVIAAFLAVYLIWGSTYLAIRVALESMPPFLMAGFRFLLAGGLVYAYVAVRGGERPTWRQWRSAAIVGTLLLMGGNGAVVWSEQRVASGAVALLVATVPLWMVFLGWLWKGTERPDWRIVVGLVLGLAGIVVLIGPAELGAGKVDVVGAIVVLLGSLSWATGSLYSRTAELPTSPLLATAMEMLAGGAVLAVVGAASGELRSVNPELVSARSLVAVGYLVLFGSLVGFTAYIWLLRATTPARVATYAYVNPVVAVLLGWAFANEPLTGRTMLAALVVLAAVALITARRERSTPPDISKPAANRPLGGRSGFAIAQNEPG